MKATFRNIGPIREAELELNDLTVIAGQNNTGKTYLAYTLYGFLKQFQENINYYSEIIEVKWLSYNAKEIVQTLRQHGEYAVPLPVNDFLNLRNRLLINFSKFFSSEYLHEVFGSPRSEFRDAKFALKVTDSSVLPDCSFKIKPRRWITLDASIRDGTLLFSLTKDEKASKISHRLLERYVSILLVRLCMGSLLKISPVILSAERFGISLFYKELDFTKNQLVDILQKLSDREERQRLDPFLIIEGGSSRYAQPIKDNIDFTRDIAAIKKRKSALSQSKNFSKLIKSMLEGYFKEKDGEIRFVSTARKPNAKFDIPLYIASSSARGLSAFYFYLLHVAQEGQLLIIDEPESHLSPSNQIALARLLVFCVNANIKVLITTHSDYILKEINNLVMLSQPFADKDRVIRKLGYAKEEFLKPERLRAYVAENSGLTACNVDKFGVDMPIFDITIDKINDISNELTFCLEDGK